MGDSAARSKILRFSSLPNETTLRAAWMYGSRSRLGDAVRLRRGQQADFVEMRCPSGS